MKHIDFQKVGLERVSEMETLMKTVWESMAKKEWFVTEDQEYLQQHMKSGKGVAWGAIDMDNNRLAGFFFAVLPDRDSMNLGYDIGMQEDQLSKVALMDIAAVLPEYRGQKIQYHLMQMAEQELKHMGYQYLMCTVHPQNTYSQNNVRAQGYQWQMTKEKYGGFLRDIFLKEI